MRLELLWLTVVSRRDRVHGVHAPAETVVSNMMPAPSAKRPFGAMAIALLPVTTLLFRLRAPSWVYIPAPSASLARGPPASLSLTIVLSTVRMPQLSIPPPPAWANWQSWVPHEKPASTDVVGAAVLSVMTLLLTVRVAPVAKFSVGGMKMPPPYAITPSSPT